MGNEFTVEFDEKEAILEVKIGSYNDIIKDGRLEDDFLNSLFEGYRSVEYSERKKHEEKLPPLKRFREMIRKKKKEYELPVKGIHLYPATISRLKSEYVRDVIAKSIGSEAEYNRLMADRWELIEDMAVGVDLIIDVSAITVGLYRYIRTGEIREGFAGFGYLAVLGMALLILYFILRIKREEPYKRKSRYLTHILRTPMTLHRRYPAEAQMTFYSSSEEMPPDAIQRPQ